MENTFHTEQFTIRANEVDTTGSLSLAAICNYFQEVAGNNAKDLNFDITDMHEQNLTWVLHRMDIHIFGKAHWRDCITVETWPAAGDTLRAYRNYRLLDEEGDEFGHCLSYWMVMNLETRRPTRIPQEVLDTRLTDRPHVTEVKSNRIRPFDDADATNSKSIIVRRADLDMNNHVNNVRYLEWMLETITLDEVQKLTNIDLIYMMETFVDDKLTASCKHIDAQHLQFKITNQNGKVIAVAEATLS
ncbi:MAG: thioesterase [bacterium]|nr:thioesterase [bacterium]